MLAVAAVVSSSACSGGGGDDDDDDGGSPTPVFEADRCQIVWLNDVTATVKDLYVLDAPVAAWVLGSNHLYSVSSSGFQAGYFGGFDLATEEALVTAIVTTGSFSLVLSGTGTGQGLGFDDEVPQTLSYTSGGVPTVVAGTGGTGSFDGFWSDPYSQNVSAGDGSITVMLDGTAHTIGTDLAYGICYQGQGSLFRPAAPARRQR